MITICANTLVKNEERYLWFAVKSVIDYVDKISIWDTGSSDKTVEIIKKLQDKYPDKIDFREVGSVDREGFTALRQKMLEGSDCDWILILDGDEVWWEDSIKKLVATILYKGHELETIVTPYVNLIGDIFHYQEGRAGRYQIDGREGHLTIRAINRKIPGLHVDMPYGKEGYFDDKNIPVQGRPGVGREFIDASYLHFSHLERGGDKLVVVDRAKKFKYELGTTFPFDYFYPEVLFKTRPQNVSSPWVKMNKKYRLLSGFITPLKKIKRRFIFTRYL